MKLVVELDKELEDAVELHFESGVPVQAYFRAALRFFRDMRVAELENNVSVGFGKEYNFSTYNTVVSPANYLKTVGEE